MKLKVNRFRTRKPDSLPPPPAEPAAMPHTFRADEMPFASNDDGFGPGTFPTAKTAPAGMEAIRHEGLTGRQLRMARRMAQKHGLPATSDFDAVRLLRQAGIDPFQRSAVLELVAGEDDDVAEPSTSLTVTPQDSVRLPQTIKPIQVPSTEVRAENAHVSEVARIQQDIARRRRRKLALLAARMAFFVFLPTLIAGWYYYMVATPLYAAKSEFQIQQADPAATAGLGGLLNNSPLGSAKDSIAVQGYLQSVEAMQRLDADLGFRAHFADPAVDPIRRLSADASNSETYKTYARNVRISYDPTEGIIKMEVAATDPQTSVAFSQALLAYAEEQVDQLTQRLREDQMQGARESFDQAEAAMLEAQRRVVELQESFKVLSSEVEVTLITSQIAALEGQLTQDRLSLAQMESNESPNQARMDPLIRRIATLEDQIAAMRAKLTEDGDSGLSLAKVQSELLVAQADVTTRQLLLGQSLAALESARVEANRQTRYLLVSVNPIAPDEPSYPRAFENTLVVMLIFAGIYLMISMTVAILREQVTA